MFYQSLTKFNWRSWKNFLSRWQRMDWILFLLVVSITGFGGLMIHSTVVREEFANYWLGHLMLGFVGVVISLTLARWRYETLLQWHWIIYAITNVLLIAVKFAGSEGGGAVRWLNIFGFHVQPSEFAKLALIITLAALLHQRPASNSMSVLSALAITAVPWALVFIQPDLGTSLAFGAITVGMLYWGNVNPGWLILMMSPMVSAILFSVYLPAWLGWVVFTAIVAWLSLPWKFAGTAIVVTINFMTGGLGQIIWEKGLEDYQKARLTLFLSPEQDPLGGGYHLIQSKIAIGAGELWGRGLHHGTQTQLNFIPEQHTDFIFSAVGEELGFVGAIGLLVAFWLVCVRLVMIALSANDDFGSLLAIGVLSMIAFQVIVNISMTIGLAPITGLPLPWVSYGRSALLTNFLAIGLVESVANCRQKKKKY